MAGVVQNNVQSRCTTKKQRKHDQKQAGCAENNLSIWIACNMQYSIQTVLHKQHCNFRPWLKNHTCILQRYIFELLNKCSSPVGESKLTWMFLQTLYFAI